MSSRVLRKLHGEKELNEEISDIEADFTAGGARKKQLNVNRYDLLNQQSHSESEVKEDDNETEANKSCEGDNNHESVKRKKRKKKKKSGKSVNNQRSSEDNADIDEVERSLREVNKLLGSVDHRHSIIGHHHKIEKHGSQRKSILNIYTKNLNPNNELKRIFGSKIIQSEHKKKKGFGGGTGRVPNTPIIRPTYLVTGKDNWPTPTRSGLSMNIYFSLSGAIPPGIQLFSIEHNDAYQMTQMKFLTAVETLNPDRVLAIIHESPYHVDALLQLADLCRLSEDLAMSAELVERALFCMEASFHPLFSLTAGNCRLDYRKQENRAFFITLYKHLLNVGSRACYRTALEFCKLLLSLDPENDPLAVKLTIDFYAIRSKEYPWFIQLCEEWDATRNLNQLPNFAFSLPLAHFHLFQQPRITSTTTITNTTFPLTDDEKQQHLDRADTLLQRALILFPSLLRPLLDACGVQPDARVARHSFFATGGKQSDALRQLVTLYVQRAYHLWRECDVLPWLERNVNVVMDRVDGGDELVAELAEKRGKWYQGGALPRSIARHIMLSDVKGVTVTPSTEDFANGVLAFDPFPPPDSRDIYTRPTRPTVSSTNSSALGLFFRSIIPTFNANEIPMNLLEDAEGALAQIEAGVGGGAVANANAGDVAGAVANVDGDGVARRAGVGGDIDDMHRSVASLVGAMRYLLNNLRPDVPNDEGDVDENDESDDDDDDLNYNNYLT